MKPVFKTTRLDSGPSISYFFGKVLPILLFIILLIWFSTYASETNKSISDINQRKDNINQTLTNILDNLNMSGSVTGNMSEYVMMLVNNESTARLQKDMILMQNVTDLNNKPVVTQVINGTGLTGGPISSTGTLHLANTPVSPGGYSNPVLQIDAQGRITSAMNGTMSGTGTVTLVASGTGLTGGPINSTGTLHLADTSVTPGGYTNPVLQIDPQGRITSATNGTTSTVTLINSGTGLTGGPINSTGTLHLDNTAVTPGGYSNPVLQIDAQGRITSATNGTMSGTGTVTLVASGTGLTGGPINSTGTLHLADTSVTPGGYMNPVLQIDPQGRITSATNGTVSTVTLINSGTGLTGGPINSTGTIHLENTTVIPGGYSNPVLQIDQQGRITGATNGTTVTLVNSGTGLTGGPINSTGTLHLADTSVTPGGYSNPVLQIDAQGRITSATNGTMSGTGTVTLVNSGTGLAGGPINSTGTLYLTNTTVIPGTYFTPTFTVDQQGRITNAINQTGLNPFIYNLTGDVTGLSNDNTVVKIQNVSISINHVIPPVNYFNVPGTMVISENSPPINQINIDSFTFKRTGRINLVGNASISQFMYDMFSIVSVTAQTNVAIKTCTSVVAVELSMGGMLSYKHCRSFRTMSPGVLTPTSATLYHMNVTEGSLFNTALEIVHDNPNFSLSYNLQSPNINNLNISLVFDTEIIVAV